MKLKKLLSVVLTVAIVLSLSTMLMMTSTANICVHNWVNRDLLQPPSATTDGRVRQICTRCGDFQDITVSRNDFAFWNNQWGGNNQWGWNTGWVCNSPACTSGNYCLNVNCTRRFGLGNWGWNNNFGLNYGWCGDIWCTHTWCNDWRWNDSWWCGVVDCDQVYCNHGWGWNNQWGWNNNQWGWNNQWGNNNPWGWNNVPLNDGWWCGDPMCTDPRCNAFGWSGNRFGFPPPTSSQNPSTPATTAASTPAPAPASTNNSGILMGDLTGSGTVTVADALLALRMATGQNPLGVVNPAAARMSGGPTVTVSDALAILLIAIAGR
jgi:hypothetical protein